MQKHYYHVATPTYMIKLRAKVWWLPIREKWES